MGVGVSRNGLKMRESVGPTRICVVGGAGFIGSHFVDRLLGSSETHQVRVFDNFSSGREWHLDHHRRDPRFSVIVGDVRDQPALISAFTGMETVVHLASNPDISRAMSEPSIDFDQGTVLTHNVLEAMRTAGAQQLLYASGSGVYGDLGDVEVTEDYGPLIPISTYGASKLAGEALIASYSFMFGIVGKAFRFGNVVGPRQTHGVGFDFILRLLQDPSALTILGDGTQSKPYIHVYDVVDAVLTASRAATGSYEVYNVAPGDYASVKEIAELAIELVGADHRTELHYTGGDRGWKGDVPLVRLNTSHIRKLGWVSQLSSIEALRASMASILDDARQGRFN